MMGTPRTETVPAERLKKLACAEIFKQNLSGEDYREFMGVNEQYEKAETTYSEQISDLELKFRSQTLPMVQKRGSILKQLSGFWAQVLLNHKDIKPFVDDARVEQFLRLYLLDIELVYAFESRFGDENQKLFGRDGIVIKAEFKNNPAFSNQFLTKAFGKRVNEDDCEIAFCEGCTIQWREDKFKDEFLGKGASEVTEAGDDDDDNVDWFSFFGWWQLSADELSDEHALDENGMDKVAKAIIDDVWSKPMEYYDLTEDTDSEEESSESEDDEDESEEVDEML